MLPNCSFTLFIFRIYTINVNNTNARCGLVNASFQGFLKRMIVWDDEMKCSIVCSGSDSHSVVFVYNLIYKEISSRKGLFSTHTVERLL